MVEKGKERKTRLEKNQMNILFYERIERANNQTKERNKNLTKTRKRAAISRGVKTPMKPQEKGETGSQDRWWVTFKAEKHYNETWTLEDKAHWLKGELWKGGFINIDYLLLFFLLLFSFLLRRHPRDFLIFWRGDRFSDGPMIVT